MVFRREVTAMLRRIAIGLVLALLVVVPSAARIAGGYGTPRPGSSQFTLIMSLAWFELMA